MLTVYKPKISRLDYSKLFINNCRVSGSYGVSSESVNNSNFFNYSFNNSSSVSSVIGSLSRLVTARVERCAESNSE